MFQLNFSPSGEPGRDLNTSAIERFIEYDPENLEKLIMQVNQMNNYIANLEQSLDELETKIRAYQKIILKYESIFNEEIGIYRLQKSKLTTLQEAFHRQELFSKEIEQQLSNFINDYLQQKNTKNLFSTIKRILLRFCHQNQLHQTTTDSRIADIEDAIHNKQQLLERFQTDVKNCKKKIPLAIATSKTESMVFTQAVGI